MWYRPGTAYRLKSDQTVTVVCWLGGCRFIAQDESGRQFATCFHEVSP